MKKLFALVLVVCMMMTGVAFAEIVQDELPPVVVGAAVKDADGNVVADNAAVVLDDIHNRATAANSAVMVAAYNAAMASHHFSDMDNLHDELNAVLADIDSHAYNLVATEMFNVALEGELAEGNAISLTIESECTVAIATADGVEWHVVEAVDNGDGTATINLKQAGVVVLLQLIAVEEETEAVVEETEVVEESEESEDKNFTPSVSGKAAPEMTSSAICDANGEVIVEIPELVITALSERDKAIDILTHEHLEWAYDAILAAEDVGDLKASETENIAAAIDAALEGTGLDHSKVVVKELFELSLYGANIANLYVEGNYTMVTLAVDVDLEAPFVVLCSHNSDNWHVVDAENVTINANGTVTLRLLDLGSIAFLVEAEADAAVVSPN